MTTVFEVCQWLVLERPDILATANQMHNAMCIPLDSSNTVVIPPTASNNSIEDMVTFFFFVVRVEHVLIFYNFIM